MSETAKFTEDILTAAKEKAQSIVGDAETETQHALEEAKAYSAIEAEDLLSDARAEADGIRRRKISEARHKLKLLEQSEKSKILTDVLDKTKSRSAGIVKDSNKYFAFVASLIARGVSEIRLAEVVVHLNSRDLKHIDLRTLEHEIAKTLDKPVKIDFSKEPIDALGGAIIASKDGRTRIVNTIDQRFDALESTLLIEAGKILFAEQ
jgi:V/A-type H+-transporting ATPase subunit E